MKSAAVFVLASFLMFAASGCGSPYTEKVVGTWEWTANGTPLTITVNKGGTGSLKGPQGEKSLKWRIQRRNNFVFNFNDGKDSGFLIDSADENTIRGNDPQAPGQPIVWTRKK